MPMMSDVEPRCPAVGCGGRLRPHYERGETDFLLCDRCGILMRHPLPTLEELGRLYTAHYRPDNIIGDATNQVSNRYAVDAYARLVEEKLGAQGKRVLDFGAGTGALIHALRARGSECEGVEFSAEARAYALHETGLKLMASLDEYGNEPCDIVTMIEVIEHLLAPWETLRDLHRRLAPRKGWMLITTPNRNSIRARREGGYWHEARKKFHLMFFDRPSLSRLLYNCGFEEQIWPRFPPIPKPGLKFQLAGRLYQALGIPGTLLVMARATA